MSRTAVHILVAAAAALAMLASATYVEAAKVVLVHGLLGFGPSEIFGKLACCEGSTKLWTNWLRSARAIALPRAVPVRRAHMQDSTTGASPSCGRTKTTRS